jgi:hypothetical protein
MNAAEPMPQEEEDKVQFIIHRAPVRMTPSTSLLSSSYHTQQFNRIQGSKSKNLLE